MPLKLKFAAASFFLASSLHHYHCTQKRSSSSQSESAYSISTSLLQAWNGVILPKLVRCDASEDCTMLNTPIIFK